MIEIRQRVLEIISEQLGKEISELHDSSAFEDIGADSLDVVEIAMMLEDEFKFEIPDEDAEGVDTVIDVIKLVEKLTNA